MEYIPGHINGRNVVKLLGNMPELYVVKVMLGVARGLAYASEKGYTHRDVKPDNLLFCFSHDRLPRDYDELFLLPDSRVALCDFGIADVAEEIRREAGQEDPDSENATILGSPLYMSPEQAVAPETVDVRSDIYSLAATAYYLLTGEPPFNGPDWESIIGKKVDNDIPVPREKDVKLTSEFARVLARMGARHPERRYQDYRSLISDLEALELLHADRAQSIKRFIYGHQKAFILGSTIILTLLICALLGSHLFTAYMLDMERQLPQETLRIHSWKGDLRSWRQEVVDGTVAMIAAGDAGTLTLKKELHYGDIFHYKLRIPGNGRVTLELREKDSDDIALAHFTCFRDEERYRVRMFSSTMDINSADSGSVPMPQDFPDSTAKAVSLKVTITRNYYTVANKGSLLGVGHFQAQNPDKPLQLNIIPVDCDGVIINEMQIIHGK
jgi:hypothetical protein